MMSTRRRDLIIVVVATIGVAVYVLTAHTLGGPGFPLDDSWIHQTYGRNLGQTGQWAYVPSVPSAGSTSPLYTILLAVGYALRVPFFAWTYGLGAAFLAATGLIGARVAERLYPQLSRVGLWTGLALVLAWHLVWTAASGMETLLFAALGLLLMVVAWREMEAGTRRVRFWHGAAFGLLGALLIATRPEGVLLVGIVGTLMIVARPQPDWRAFLAWATGALAGWLIGLLPYALLNYSLNGTVLPNTFSAKQAEYSELLSQPFLFNLWTVVQPLTAGGQLLLVPGLIAGAVVLWRHIAARRCEALYLAPLLWPAALILVYTVRLPVNFQHGRYVIPALPSLICAGVGGTFLLAGQRRSLLRRVLIRALIITTLSLFLIFWVLGATIFGREVQMINSDMVVASRWLAEQIPPDQLLAVHDIGAVGYFAPRPILDLAGLISPEVVPIIRDGDALMALMQSRGVRYLMVLPPQRPAPADDPRLCERFNARGLMGGMVIYEMAWNGRCP
jgi:hypothetical protein